MRAPSTTTKLMAWAGLIVGGVAWAGNTQLGEILPTADCIGRHHLSAIISFAGAIVVLASGGVSWRLDGRTSAGDDRTLPFAARLSALAALVFTFALLMQGAASLVLTGCEH
jgi:hypothetical protein